MQYLADADLYFPDRERHMTGTAKNGQPVWKDYQGDRLAAALPHVTDRSCAVDVGAHVGLLSRQLAAHFDCVYSFEPDPENYACLVRNTEKYPNVWPIPRGLSSQPGQAGLEKTATANSGDRQLDPHGVGIRLLRLDDFDLRRCGLIKIDVQGYEYHVLKGARATLAAFSPVVIVECEPPGKLRRQFTSPDKVDGLLTKLDAQLVTTIASDRIYRFGPDGAAPYWKYKVTGAYHWRLYELGKTQRAVDAVVNYVGQQGHRSLLDIGCGDGLFTVKLAAQVPSVVGIDQNAEAVRLAVERGANARHLSIYRAAELGRTFDACLMCDTFEHLHKCDLALQVCAGMARTLYIHNPEPLNAPDHVREFTAGELAAYVAARGWRIVRRLDFMKLIGVNKSFFHLER